MFPSSLNAQFLTSPETLDLTSTDANDTAAGSGLQQVMVQGLDGNYDRQTEMLPLAGLGAATTNLSYLRFERAVGMDTGGSDSNLGDITIAASVTPLVMGFMEAKHGISRTFAHTVPRGINASLLLTMMHIGKIGKIKDDDAVHVKMWFRVPPSKCWVEARDGYIRPDGIAHWENPLPGKLSPMTDIYAGLETIGNDFHIGLTNFMIEEEDK
jgi:hypothetical protein